MPHIHDKIDFTAEVFIVFDGKVLLRKHDKYKLWLSVGGHVELDEDPTQAAVREVKEDVGLDIELLGQVIRVANEGQKGYQELIPPRFMNRHRVSETHEHVTMTYFGITEMDQVRNQTDELSDELRWFTDIELEDVSFSILDSVKQYAKAALRECR